MSDFTEYIKDRHVVRDFWNALRERMPEVLEPTQCGPNEEMSNWVVAWYNGKHHVDVDLFVSERPDDFGANEWFYMNRKTRMTDGDEDPSDWDGLIGALRKAGMITKEA